MNAHAMDLRWDGAMYAEEADRGFRKVLIAVAIPFIVLSVLLSLVKLDERRTLEAPYVPPATVELLPSEEPAEQTPAPVAEKIEEPAPAREDRPEPPKEAAPVVKEKVVKPVEQTPKPVPVPVDPTVKAREVAQKSGVLAFADQLSDLRNKGEINNTQTLSPSVLASKGAAGAPAGASGGDGGEGALAAAAAGSQGIGGNGTASVSSTQSGQGLGKRRTSTVASPVGFGRDKAKSEGNGSGGAKRGGRSQDEIQLVFDRAQSSFYSMYLRALRENAMLSGKVIISVTIAPSGSVSSASIVSSELGDPELEAKIISKVRSLNFGAKEVPDFTYPNYRITFKPPN